MMPRTMDRVNTLPIDEHSESRGDDDDRRTTVSFIVLHPVKLRCPTDKDL